MRTGRLIIAAGFFFGLWNLVSAQNGYEQVEEGNELFAEQKFDEANIRYRDALLENPESPIVHFNIGDVLYKKGSYEEAIKSYDKALAADDINLQAQAYYNIGNALYKTGKLAESIQAYKKALELNPEDEDAKYNLEYVRRKLKDSAQNPPPQDQQQNQQQSDQQQHEGQQGQNEQGQGEQQQQGEQGQEQQKQEQQNREKSQAQSKEDESERGEVKQQQAAGEQEISREDAERILNALKDEEGDLMKQREPNARGRAFRGKDW